MAGWGAAEDQLGFPAGPGYVIPGLPSTATCCAAFRPCSRGAADQDRVVLLPGTVGEHGFQGGFAPVDTWNIHGAGCHPTRDDACPDDWHLPDAVGSMDGGDDGVKRARLHVPLPMLLPEQPQARSPMHEPPSSADEDDRKGGSDDCGEADKSAEAAFVTDETSQVSTVALGTDLDSQESVSVFLPSDRGSPCHISDMEQLPALLISGPYSRGANPNEVPDKISFASDVASRVDIVDSAAASDASKPGSPALLESSSVDVALQQEGQVGNVSESLDKPSRVTIPVEEKIGGGSPQQWPGIDRDSLYHISNMNLRPPRSRRTLQTSGRASIENTVSVPRGASGTTHLGGATRSSGGSTGRLLPAQAAGKRVEELLLW